MSLLSPTRSSGAQVQPPVAEAVPPLAESRKQQVMRHGHRARLYTWAVMFIVALVVLIVLIAANLRSVKLDWVAGSADDSLVWIILTATVLGWLLGVATSVLFRFRTRRRQAQ
jgi:uncharacterized integral membrane protein